MQPQRCCDIHSPNVKVTVCVYVTNSVTLALHRYRGFRVKTLKGFNRRKVIGECTSDRIDYPGSIIFRLGKRQNKKLNLHLSPLVLM